MKNGRITNLKLGSKSGGGCTKSADEQTNLRLVIETGHVDMFSDVYYGYSIVT